MTEYSYYKIQIGPYLKVIEFFDEIKIDKCKDHNFPSEAKYCPECGKHKKYRFNSDFKSKAPDNWKILYDKDNESKYSIIDSLKNIIKNPGFALINNKYCKKYTYVPTVFHDTLNIISVFIETDITEEIEIQNLKVKESINNFKNLFSKEIAFMKKFFEIEIKFGCIYFVD